MWPEKEIVHMDKIAAIETFQQAGQKALPDPLLPSIAIITRSFSASALPISSSILSMPGKPAADKFLSMGRQPFHHIGIAKCVDYNGYEYQLNYNSRKCRYKSGAYKS